MKKKLILLATILLAVCPMTLLAQKYTKYLFVYFPSNDNENIYYALSDKERPFDFVPMNDGKMVISADTLALKKGVRDPHVLRGEDGWFYMVNTDMRCAEGWASNRGIVLMRSKDLVNWQHSTVHFPEKYKGTNFANVTRVWAPETNHLGSKGQEVSGVLLVAHQRRHHSLRQSVLLLCQQGLYRPGRRAHLLL